MNRLTASLLAMSAVASMNCGVKPLERKSRPSTSRGYSTPNAGMYGNEKPLKKYAGCKKLTRKQRKARIKK